MDKPNGRAERTKVVRLGLVLIILALAFVATYEVALGLNGGAATEIAQAGTAARPNAPAGARPWSPDGASAAQTPACACCGGSGQSTPIEGTASIEDGVQRITIDTSSGSYNPNVIKLKAGLPAEITFKQASGCLGQVQSEQLGFYEDLTRGDVTVKIAADKLQPGSYSFSCGMQMVFGTITVE